MHSSGIKPHSQHFSHHHYVLKFSTLNRDAKHNDRSHLIVRRLTSTRKQKKNISVKWSHVKTNTSCFYKFQKLQMDSKHTARAKHINKQQGFSEMTSAHSSECFPDTLWVTSWDSLTGNTNISQAGTGTLKVPAAEPADIKPTELNRQVQPSKIKPSCLSLSVHYGSRGLLTLIVSELRLITPLSFSTTTLNLSRPPASWPS